MAHTTMHCLYVYWSALIFPQEATNAISQISQLHAHNSSTYKSVVILQFRLNYCLADRRLVEGILILTSLPPPRSVLLLCSKPVQHFVQHVSRQTASAEKI